MGSVPMFPSRIAIVIPMAIIIPNSIGCVPKFSFYGVVK